jgi:hypothetical protein
MHSSQEIIRVSLRCKKLCATLDPKMITGTHKTQRTASAWTFFERYTKIATKQSHFTGDWCWKLGLFVNVETEEQSKQLVHKHTPNIRRILNKRLSENWSSMSLRVLIRVQQLAIEHYWSFWSGSCFANFLTALISLRRNSPCLATSRTGCAHGASI